MVNRLEHLLGRIPEAASYTDYYELEAQGGTYIVSLSTALAVERHVDRTATPEGVEFRDVFGARHRLPARCVYRISESTRTRRALRQA